MRSCRGSTAAVAKLAPCFLTRSSPAWRKGLKSSATCRHQSVWSWPQPSASPRLRWAGAGRRPRILRPALFPSALNSSRTME
ncbi:hypothetical protein LEMLEM_LOCUS23106 [Lemmus lemmus]